MATITIATGPQWAKHRDAKRFEVEALWSERGLAVTPVYSASARRTRQQGWAITHIASGYAVKSGISSHRSALALARRLLDAGDWTRSRTAVTTDRRLRDRCAQILDEAKLLGLVK